jgi:predicted MPP superfamily phosphohydrolase
LKRRKFIKGILSLIGLGLTTGLYGWKIEPFWLEFVKMKMPIKNLPKNLNGLSLMQISDIHIGNRFDWNFIVKSFKKADLLKPDFVVYTGDFIHYEDTKQIEQLKEVFENSVKGKLGTIAILGNHDYGKNWAQDEVAESVVQTLQESGILVLRNEEKEVHGLNFIGFDDYWATNFQPKKTMKSYNNKKANIVLCHNPDVCDLDIWNNYKGWILSGHTHGGQVKLPFINPPVLPVKNKKYIAGEIDLKDGRTLYINRALGHLWQIRLNVRPEITIFKLETA